jgi:hypothetical protein
LGNKAFIKTNWDELLTSVLVVVVGPFLLVADGFERA